MSDNYSNWYQVIESLLGKKMMTQKTFYFQVKAAPRRPFSIAKMDGKIQIILDELDPGRDQAGGMSYAALGTAKGVDKFIMIYSVSDNQLIPIFGQMAELLPLYLDVKVPDSTGQLATLATSQFSELRFGNYQDVAKLGSGTHYRALSNLNLKDKRYDRDSVITEAEFSKIEGDHFRAKFAPIEIKNTETVPKKLFEVGAPLSVKPGWLCRGGVSTKDGTKFVRDAIYTEEQMKKCPKDKFHKFIPTGQPSTSIVLEVSA